MIRVFVVDDSTFFRKAMMRVLSADPHIRVVGGAADGHSAIRMIPRIRPDLVTLDIDMPGLNGLDTLRVLRESEPDLSVIMLSALSTGGAEVTLNALDLGALDFIDKSTFSLMDFDLLARELLEKIRACGVTGGRRRRTDRKLSRKPPSVMAVKWSDYEICVIGASTGGPAALHRIFREIRGDFPVPVAVVQHMPEGFVGAFVDRLNCHSQLEIKEAEMGDRMERGQVLVAQARKHLRIESDLSVTLPARYKRNRFIPSIDVTMKSAVEGFGESVVGIILTGMGNDGQEGMQAIHEHGGLTIAESEETCTVYGMPRAAHLRGAVSHLLPLYDIVRLFQEG